MSREMQLRDTEILQVLGALMVGAEDKDDIDSDVRETAKRCDCAVSRVNEAVERVVHDSKHIYWREVENGR